MVCTIMASVCLVVCIFSYNKNPKTMMEMRTARLERAEKPRVAGIQQDEFSDDIPLRERQKQ